MAKFKDLTLVPKQYCDGGSNSDSVGFVIHSDEKKGTLCQFYHELRHVVLNQVQNKSIKRLFHSNLKQLCSRSFKLIRATVRDVQDGKLKFSRGKHNFPNNYPVPTKVPKGRKYAHYSLIITVYQQEVNLTWASNDGFVLKTLPKTLFRLCTV